MGDSKAATGGVLSKKFGKNTEIFKNSFFTEHLRATVSGNLSTSKESPKNYFMLISLIFLRITMLKQFMKF